MYYSWILRTQQRYKLPKTNIRPSSKKKHLKENKFDRTAKLATRDEICVGLTIQLCTNCNTNDVMKFVQTSS